VERRSRLRQESENLPIMGFQSLVEQAVGHQAVRENATT
jgi:hypothetical protein